MNDRTEFIFTADTDRHNGCFPFQCKKGNTSFCRLGFPFFHTGTFSENPKCFAVFQQFDSCFQCFHICGLTVNGKSAQRGQQFCRPSFFKQFFFGNIPHRTSHKACHGSRIQIAHVVTAKNHAAFRRNIFFPLNIHTERKFIVDFYQTSCKCIK